jgi:hypothetical protein
MSHKWVIVVEGDTDVRTYNDLFDAYEVEKNEVLLISAHGKGNVCNTEMWDKIQQDSQISLLEIIKNDIGRYDFLGIILIVDSDDNSNRAFGTYKRCKDSLLYSKPDILEITKGDGEYWRIDSLNGKNVIPILGINVPANKSGCLETDLLNTYGFPIEGQPEYETFTDIIKESSRKWCIESQSNKKWWNNNEKAKIDKFIYSALSHGFHVCRQKLKLPKEPDVIKRIKEAIKNK